MNKEREMSGRQKKKENIKSKFILGLFWVFFPLTLAQGPQHSLLVPFSEGATTGHEDKPQARQREGTPVLHGNMPLLKKKKDLSSQLQTGWVVVEK